MNTRVFNDNCVLLHNGRVKQNIIVKSFQTHTHTHIKHVFEINGISKILYIYTFIAIQWWHEGDFLSPEVRGI